MQVKSLGLGFLDLRFRVLRVWPGMPEEKVDAAACEVEGLICIEVKSLGCRIIWGLRFGGWDAWAGQQSDWG